MAEIFIDGHRIEYLLSGNDEPVIVFLNGHNMAMTSWDDLIPHLAEGVAVLRYNRPGTGGSSQPTRPQTGLAVCRLLSTLLTELGIATPVVLVGHSLGGLYANLFAREYPTLTRAVVLLEAGHPSEASERAKQLGILGRNLDRLLNLGSRSRRNPNSEFNGVDATVQELANAADLPNDLAVAVVSGAKKMPFVPSRAFEQHQEFQRALAELTGHTTHVIASESGHFPQLTEPAMVADVIAELLATSMARSA